jgi:hypothetical protein
VHEETLLDVDAENGNHHDTYRGCRPKGHQKPKRQQKTTSGFGQAGEKSMTPTRTKSQPFFKELSGAVQPESAEPTKQHL